MPTKISLDPESKPKSVSQWFKLRPQNVYSAFAVLVVGRLAYEMIVLSGVQQSAVLYVGLPAVLAAVTMLTLPDAPSFRAVTMVMTTLFLLGAMIMVGPWSVCILMAAPIIYMITFWMASLQPRIDDRRDPGGPGRSVGLALVPFALMSLEGTPIGPSFDRTEQVSVTRVVEAKPCQVRIALAQPLRTERVLPAFLRLGFPRPVGVQGAGAKVGDRWTIDFLFEGRPVSLELELVESSAGRLRYAVVEDGTPIAGWLALEATEVTWEEVSAHRTEVTWTFHYERLLDPAWYFGPLERFGVRRAADYLITAAATP